MDGRFNNVTLTDAMGGGTTYTLNGTFSLTLVNQAGSVTCTSTPPPDTDADVQEATPNECHTGCEQGDGVCCPYAQCLGECWMQCAFSQCMSGDVVSCNACVVACYSTCNVSSECNQAAQAIETCANNAGCNLMDEDETCMVQNCCSQAEAAFR